MLVLHVRFNALKFLTLMMSSLVFFRVLLLQLFYFFFQLPPRLALFPYPTLFRSAGFRGDGAARGSPAGEPLDLARVRRSEEHTSELQSHHDRVCGLLLATENNDVGMEDVGILFVVHDSDVPKHVEAVPSFVSGAM